MILDTHDRMYQIKRCSQKIMACFYKHRIVLFLTLIYGISIIYISSFHVVWRDEARALSIATESKSIAQLFQNLHNDGHPFLWHFILYVGFRLTQSAMILKITSILIAVSAVYLFLLKSPFSSVQKVLFIFGFFPIYQYSVICRNYGISMLLLFSFCSLYKNRYKNITLVSVVLFLLANTNVHSLIITIAIFLLILSELIWNGKDIIKDKNTRNKIITGLTITAFGILFSILQVYPDRSTIATNMYHLRLYSILKESFAAVIFPGESFRKVFVFPFVPVSIIIWLFYIYLLKNPFLSGICFISITGLALFGRLVYPLHTRHQGFLYILIIAALWIDDLEEKRIEITINPIKRAIVFYKNVFLYILLVMQIMMAYKAVIKEFNIPDSSSKSFAEFLRKHAELKDAIIIGEPDYAMESVVYYAKNQIYIPREGRFGKTVKFTTENKQEFSLKELLETAKKLKYEFKHPVVIAIGHSLEPGGPFVERFAYGKVFTYSEEQLRIFLESTKKIADFHKASSDEKYDVFLLE